MSGFDLRTLNDVFVRATGWGGAPIMQTQESGGGWTPISSDELYGRVCRLAGVFLGWGLGKGDRVVLLSENRWEWAVTDFAVLAIGAVDVPLYSTLTPAQLGYMLRDSGARVAVVSSKEQYDKLKQAGECPALEHVLVMDAGEFAGAQSFGTLVGGENVRAARDAEFDARVAAAAEPDDLATIIYTSGTTGEPKGVRLTHGNLASNVNVSTRPFGFTQRDSCISFLPLSHVTARHLDYALMCDGTQLAYCQKFDLLPAAMKAVQPTIFVGVPRVYEKIRQAVEGKSAASPVKSSILKWALATGKKYRQETLEGRTPSSLGWSLANKLVYSKIREAFGGQVRTWVSGGAPLGMETAGWFADAGIRVFEGYGLTETSPVIALSVPLAHRIGTVGKRLANVEIRFAADGELEVRGPSIFSGYWNKEAETTEAFTADGWFKTGDIGDVDEDGYLSITDRKKELLKTSGGKMIAPQPIESRLKGQVLVAHAAVVGDKHKYLSVLISPNLAALESWAKSHGVTAANAGALVEHAWVKAEYQRIVDEVNQGLAQYETMKRVHVVAEEWTVEGGELTPSMKMKRRVVEQRYASSIEALYVDETHTRVS